MISLIALAVLLFGGYIGFKIGVWYANSPTRKAASAVRNGAQGGLDGVKGLFRKAKDMISGEKPKGPNDKEKK